MHLSASVQEGFTLQFKIITAAAVAAMALSISSAASASVDIPVPANAYISLGGLDWAWASPLPGDPDFDLAYQSQFGWRLPTAEELANAPLASQFIFLGANVPLGGSDANGAYFEAANANLTGAAACAAPYFGSGYTNCDWQDGLGQPLGPWWGMDDAYFLGDQLYVRETGVAPTGPVPEPTTWALLIAGFGGVGLMLRRRRIGATA